MPGIVRIYSGMRPIFRHLVERKSKGSESLWAQNSKVIGGLEKLSSLAFFSEPLHLPAFSELFVSVCKARATVPAPPGTWPKADKDE